MQKQDPAVQKCKGGKIQSGLRRGVQWFFAQSPPMNRADTNSPKYTSQPSCPHGSDCPAPRSACRWSPGIYNLFFFGLRWQFQEEKMSKPCSTIGLKGCARTKSQKNHHGFTQIPVLTFFSTRFQKIPMFLAVSG